MLQGLFQVEFEQEIGKSGEDYNTIQFFQPDESFFVGLSNLGSKKSSSIFVRQGNVVLVDLQMVVRHSTNSKQ